MMLEEEIEKYLGKNCFLKFQNGKSLFCFLRTIDRNVLLVKTHRVQKIKTEKIVDIEYVPPENVNAVLERLGVKV